MFWPQIRGAAALRLRISVEVLVLAAALFWLLTANLPFLEALLAHSSAQGTAAVVLAVALVSS